MRLRKLAVILVLAMGASILDAHVPDYAITLDGLNGKPFANGNYGLGGSARFEWRPFDMAAYGLGFHYLQISDSSSALDTFVGADLSFRWLPFSTRYVEPYFLFNAGYDYLDQNDVKRANNQGFFGQAGAGFQFPLSRAWAIEAGADYQSRSTPRLPNTILIRAGLQYRFDFEPTPVPTPIVTDLKPHQIKAAVLENGETLSLKVPSALPQAELKEWKIEVVTHYGRTLKVLQGVGPIPRELDMTGLAGYDDLRFIAQLTPKDGSEDEYSSGKVISTKGPVTLEPEETPVVPAPAVVKVDQIVVAGKDYLWDIAAKPEVYDDPFYYFLIFDANTDKLKDPDHLPTGAKLRIPRDFTNAQRVNALKRAWSYRDLKPKASAPQADPAKK